MFYSFHDSKWRDWEWTDIYICSWLISCWSHIVSVLTNVLLYLICSSHRRPLLSLSSWQNLNQSLVIRNVCMTQVTYNRNFSPFVLWRNHSFSTALQPFTRELSISNMHQYGQEFSSSSVAQIKFKFTLLSLLPDQTNIIANLRISANRNTWLRFYIYPHSYNSFGLIGRMLLLVDIGFIVDVSETFTLSIFKAKKKGRVCIHNAVNQKESPP